MKCLNPVLLNVGPVNAFYRLPVPCGKCLNCLSNRRSEWSLRMSLEQSYSDYTAFCTMTYDDEHCPRDELYGNGCLCKKDVVDFLKRYRKRLSSLGVILRYYVCGEYGSKTSRPHYHAMFFFTDGDDGSVIASHIGDIIQMFRDSWIKGTIVDFQAACSGGASMYVSKYVIKVEDDDYVQTMRRFGYPPFSLKSQGIGRAYIDKFRHWHNPNSDNDDLVHNKYYVQRDGFKYALPRYFRSKLFPRDEPLDFDDLKKLIHEMVVSDDKLLTKCKTNWIRLHGSSPQSLSLFEKQYSLDLTDLLTDYRNSLKRRNSED